MNKSRHILLRWLLGSLLVVAVLTVAAGIALYRGLELGPVSIGSIQIERAFLQLDRKLTLDVSGVRIPVRDDTEPAAKLDPANVQKMLRAVDYLQLLFSAIDIRDIEVGKLSVNFRYREEGAGHLDASGPGMDISLGLDKDGDDLLVTIKHVRLQNQGLDLSGDVNIDTQRRELRAQLHAVIADTLPISLQLQADREQLSFQGRGEAPITDLAPIVALFKLGPTIDPWIVDYLGASEIILKGVSGTLPYKDPAQILQTLRAEALVKDTEYTFAPGLEPVLAAQTRVVFTQGILHIYPDDATFYGQDTGDTYVDIDFNNGQAIVMVYVRTRAQASGGIITLLEYYGIPFPYHQVSGLTDADLDLRIDLGTVEIEADGRFIAKDSKFKIGEQHFDVAHLDLGLKTTAISFNRLDVAMPGLLSGSVTGQLDVSSGQGELDIALEHFRWQQENSDLALKASPDKPLRLKYHFRPDDDSIEVAASNWQFADMPIELAAFTTPFDAGTFSGSLKNVDIAINPWLSARVSGQYQGQSPYADLKIRVHKLKGENLRLEQRSIDLAVKIDSGVRVSTRKLLHLSLDGIGINLQPLRVSYQDNVFKIEKSAFEVDPGTTAGLQGYYNLASHGGRMLLHDLKLMGRDGKPLFLANRSIYLNLSREKGAMNISMPRIGLSFSHRNSGSWSLDIDNFSHLYTHSPLMQQLKLSKGELHVFSATGGTPYQIAARINAPYGLLMDRNHKPISDYRISGHYDGRGIKLNVNKKLQLEWRGAAISIVSQDIGYSLPALLDIIEDVSALEPDEPDATSAQTASAVAKSESMSGPKPEPEPASAKNAGLTLNMHARNSAIAIGEERHIPVDSLIAHYGDGKTWAQFHYGKGTATLEYADDTLYFAGEELDVAVLSDLLTLADFEGGTVEFNLNGPLDNLHVVFRIKNTVIKDYKSLNNMLAFINTLPGLLTFNPPNYSSEGLPVREALAELKYRDGVIELLSLWIDSDELDLKGTGTIDLKNETTDMTFNMVSGAKKSIQRIPLLGFILSGDNKNPTLTLKVKGDMYDPEISNTAAMDIVTYPWQLIKRTILLPDHIAKQITKHGEPDAATP